MQRPSAGPTFPQMKAIIFGASGMVGSEVLHLCLEQPRIDQVISVVRRPGETQHAKLREVVHHDYLNYATLADELALSDVCFFCIGVYQGAVPAARFWEITYDYVDRLIDVYERVKPDVTFCLFGASGADPSERSPFLFARAKGRAEKRLTDSRLTRKFIFRPGYIHPGRTRPRTQRAAWLSASFYKFFPSVGIDAQDLARVMVNVGLNGHAHSLLRNGEMRELAGRQS